MTLKEITFEHTAPDEFTITSIKPALLDEGVGLLLTHENGLQQKVVFKTLHSLARFALEFQQICSQFKEREERQERLEANKEMN